MAATPRRPARIALIVMAALLGAAVAVVALANVVVRVAFAPFYEHAEPSLAIPGIGEGFVCQDLDRLDVGGSWLFSGYMADGSASPLYRVGPDGAVSRVFLELPGGGLYDDHGSAVTSAGGRVLVAREGGYLVLDEAAVAGAADGAAVGVLGQVDLGFSPSFMNAEDGYLLAGVFYHPGDYETPEAWRLTTPDGTENPSMMFAFPADADSPAGFSVQPAAAFSIPGMIQGVCVSDGAVVLSQSFGLAPSHLYAYDGARLTRDGTFPDGGLDVPLYCLDGRSLAVDLAAPPMTEGIESFEGRVMVSEESASAKYLFGRLYGAGRVYAVEL
ncbi:hypothetical protein [Adlercreutzia faecimuris]|uniref:Uncharacterized protein n=1 Tax=Adlercreutzia faecimuris TaxID=2897341 RepID=A0ABS9WGB0_9ACTN|nr:hypothetical protein [Adlercreutzia sp. JBNU-10]MCI2241898.1 hypothetical protein [Adlercreutzia sp. JBNU-10]